MILQQSNMRNLPLKLWLAVSQLGVHLMEYKGQVVTRRLTSSCKCTPVLLMNNNCTLQLQSASLYSMLTAVTVVSCVHTMP